MAVSNQWGRMATRVELGAHPFLFDDWRTQSCALRVVDVTTVTNVDDVSHRHVSLMLPHLSMRKLATSLGTVASLATSSIMS